ncbi:UPF0280 family protein [Pseudodesulfovibrio indicus]|uniref:Thiamine biosynthesis protein ApbE n=1 Tax=Pseudodesulfovibrio indicus TaxID=1716143 RepID=A0A126QR27_9BACT|nr:UPF0280 family protein [Pseudodesulfovibrio indicus]AMK12404.1 thiamine biosynthesis protein ApbE [Pseudodesulfovibrio indicus]TDT90702.1 hypothetical protein EDC59_102132 [Pseudodesulfovibrio indicus]
MGGRHLSAERGYRRMVRAREGEVRFQVGVEQTDLLVVAELDLRDEVAAYVARVRGEIKNWILFHPEFAESLVPVPVPDTAPDVVRAMAEAAAKCGVGPMAAVAGAVAQAVGDAFADRSPNILVENGGDTYLRSTRERVVALLADPGSGAAIGLRLEENAFPVALCASSGTIGHSLSLGSGDLVAVRAEDARFADAAATALANLLDSEADMDRVLRRARELAAEGLQGVFAQYDAKVAAWGDLELVALD